MATLQESIEQTIMFQAESRKSGTRFEDLVLLDLGKMGFEDVKKNVLLHDVGVEVDFAYQGHSEYQVYVEAKGGQRSESKRPGAKRTDNVKKAIANGALIKFQYPGCLYIVYFSDLPKKNGSSDKMLKKAIQAGYIDSVRYLIDLDN